MPDRTVGQLIHDKAVSADEVDAAVDAYLIGVPGAQFELADGWRLNLKAAIKASAFATETLAKPEAGEPQRRNAVRTAILLATPTKAKGL